MRCPAKNGGNAEPCAFGSEDGEKLGFGKLCPHAVLHLANRVTVEKALSCLCSSLTPVDTSATLHASRQNLEHRLWDRLFTKVKAHVKHECCIVLRRCLLIQVNNSSFFFAKLVEEKRCALLMDSKGFLPLKSFHIK